MRIAVVGSEGQLGAADAERGALPVERDQRHRVDRLAHLRPADLQVQVGVGIAAAGGLARARQRVPPMHQLAGRQRGALQQVAVE